MKRQNVMMMAAMVAVVGCSSVPSEQGRVIHANPLSQQDVEWSEKVTRPDGSTVERHYVQKRDTSKRAQDFLTAAGAIGAGVLTGGAASAAGASAAQALMAGGGAAVATDLLNAVLDKPAETNAAPAAVPEPPPTPELDAALDEMERQ